MHTAPLRASVARPPCDARRLNDDAGSGGGLLAFLALAFGFTWACWLSTTWIPAGRWHWVASTLGQFGPFLAAVVVTARESGRAGLRALFSQFTQWRFRPAWWAVALLLPPATCYAAIGAKTLFTGEPPAIKPDRLTYDVAANFFIILVVGGPLGEEPGWRGFALHRLRMLFGRHAGAIVLGVVWAVWRLPTGWRVGELPAGMIGLSVAGMTAMSLVFASLYDRTGGSLPACLLLHASLNTFFTLLPMGWAYGWWVGVAWVSALGIALTTGEANRRCPPRRIRETNAARESIRGPRSRVDLNEPT